MTKDDLFGFMSGHKLAVLSSISETGAPQSALVAIAVTAEFEIIFDTVKSSRKYGNLMANPAAAFVVGCASEQTVQYEGVAMEATGKELERCQAAYFAALPDGPGRLSWPGICYFVVRPSWIRFSDYRERPALIEEFRFGN